jgi:hypothetical protein
MLTKEELVQLTEQLKQRIVSLGRGTKADLPTDLRQDLLGALDHLSDLAAELSHDSTDLCDLNSDRTHSEDQSCTIQLKDSLAESASLPAAFSVREADLTSLISDVVSSSLDAWQSQFTDKLLQSILQTQQQTIVENPPSTQPHDELNDLILQELESDLTDLRLQLDSANNEKQSYNSSLRLCRDQLERAADRIAELEMSQMHASASSSESDRVERLEQQLDEAFNELTDLREQNKELAAKLAQQAAHAATSNSSGRPSSEQLSWEERKTLILKQLEGVTSSDGPSIPDCDKVELREIIESSQAEILRRDQEIEELREIIKLQSNARDGLAIGAAGVAHMIESDELVQQERQKLRDIQQEWETKLRQAEIDLSMERAKIARERLAMEKQKDELSHLQVNTVPKEKTIERRWLRILGLKEEG